ncbi:uncharacterized protein LOC135483728 [Lineus longissimus]|uniref:uncharacterized protein LOC135483728 n=1 Tax=Lineus longissimus TaxID=88925 RepID=UPI002B4C808A
MADEVKLERDTTTCTTVHLHGATVTDWQCKGKKLLFLSQDSVFDNKKAIRGGIPLVFPNFGPWSLGPQHGFARISRWSLETGPTKDSNGDVTAVFSLTDNDDTRKMWNHNFKLIYTVVLKELSLETKLQVDNTGPSSFDFTCLLHTYFQLQDVTKSTVTGLKGLRFIDKVQDGATCAETRDLVMVTEHTDRVYEGAASDHVLNGVSDGSVDITIQKSNLPDTVVWNPWDKLAAKMGDFGDTEWPNMLCVEAGLVSDRQVLQQGESFSCSQTLTVSKS